MIWKNSQIFFVLYLLSVYAKELRKNRKDSKSEVPDVSEMIESTPFEGFMKKYSVSHYYKNSIFKKESSTNNRRSMKTGRKMMDIIDPTDELLNFDVDKLTFKENITSSRRFFEPPGRIIDWRWHSDTFSIRGRFHELMKQAIYEARDAIVIVQELREEFKWHSLYKMGFLFSKTDDQVKLFTQLAQKFHMTCVRARELHNDYRDRMDLIKLASAFERMLNHWLEIDLLTDIIKVNDNSARKTLRSMTDLNELDTWFIDEFEDIYHIQKTVAAERLQKRREKEAAEKRKAEALKKQENPYSHYLDLAPQA